MTRDALLRLLRRYARRNELAFELDMDGGKGSHYVLWLGGRYTTLQSGELSPLHVKRILKQLGIDPTVL